MISKLKKINVKNLYWLNSSLLLILAAVVGLGAGFSAVGFQKLIELFHKVFFDGGQKFFSPVLGGYYLILIPALGGLLVGIIVHTLARRTKGESVPEVMDAIAEKDGILKPRLIIDKAVTSAITIGAGGSAGREGPIITIGSAIGSAIGQLFRLSPSMIKTLLACGAAGAISATFNAPIGGVLLAQELILGEFMTNHFIMIVISSVSSVIVSRIFMGNYPAFKVFPYEMVSPTEMIFYIVLGILSGLFAVLYIKSLYTAGDIFKKIKHIPDYIKPAVGGLIVGTIGIYFPQVFGVGYESIEMVLKNGFPWMLVLILLFMKLIATSVTLGSGAPGGDFAPGLYMGAMLGGSFGFLVNSLFPMITAPAGAYALVGMGGVLAGMAQIPVTAIILIFEMTGDYLVVLPLMVVCVISSLVAGGLYPETIYTEKLARKGLDIHKKENIDIMAGMLVSQVMSSQVVSLDAKTDLQNAREMMLKYSFTGFPVLKDGELIGLVTYEDVLKEIRGGRNNLNLGQVVNDNLITVNPDHNIRQVMDKMARGDVGRLPVVSKTNSRELLGIVSRSDIIDAYAAAAERRAQ